MPFGYTSAVPVPSTLVDGRVGLYTRRRAYVNSTTGAVEGGRTEVMLYNASGVAVKGGVYRMVFDGDEETNPKIADLSTQTVAQYAVVALRATPDATWDWFAIEGEVDALVDGDATDVAKDDFLKVVTATNGDAFIQDSADTISAASIARAMEATTAVESLKKVFLLGEKATMG